MNDDPQKLDMICVNYDVTELKETEQRLIEAKERAEESDRLKSAFLANMSHEIRTPLNAIVGFSDLLAESDDREERFGYLKIVQENNELLLQLISDILDLSKIEAGTFKFINDRVNVYQLCNEIVRSYSIKIKNHHVKLIFDEQSPVYYITSDKKHRVIQVLSNFINNALKFTSQGTITLGYELLPNHELKLYVCDTGQGIAEEKQKSHIRPFRQIKYFRSRYRFRIIDLQKSGKTNGRTNRCKLQRGRRVLLLVHPSDLLDSNREKNGIILKIKDFL